MRADPPAPGSFEQATDFHALRQAARRAARGTHTRAAAAFLIDLEAQVLRLQGELRAGAYRPGPFTTFRIVDPKPRTISAAPFRDRVVHHALCATLEPELERFADPDSYACRRGKGTLAAVRRVQALCRRHPWFAKIDVLHCFETTDLDLLLERLSLRCSDPDLLGLCRTILQAGGPGLPIGNLTSQHFANFSLGFADHYAREHLRVAAWVRYMDDMVLFGPDKETVSAQADALAAWLITGLHQHERPDARRLAPVSTGFPFLGFRIWPQRLRLDAARKRRLARRLRLRDPIRLQSALAWAAQADTRGLRVALLHRGED